MGTGVSHLKELIPLVNVIRPICGCCREEKLCFVACRLSFHLTSVCRVSDDQKLKYTALVHVVKQRYINIYAFGLGVRLILVIVLQKRAGFGAWFQRECVASACRALNI